MSANQPSASTPDTVFLDHDLVYGRRRPARSSLADLRGERGARPIQQSTPDSPSADEHAELLRSAGFAEVGTVWQVGDDRAVVALGA